MDLRDSLIKKLEDNNIKVEKVKGRHRTLYKVNGIFLYITYKEKGDQEPEFENYYLQVNKIRVKEVLKREGSITIFVICGSLSQIISIEGKNFLELTKFAKVEKSGNIQFNVYVTKRKSDFKIKFTGLGVIDVNEYVNSFEKCSLTDNILNVITKISEKDEYYDIPGLKEIEIPQIRTIRKEKFYYDKSNIEHFFISGDGDKLEKFIIKLFEFWGFSIDEKYSGKSGELDVICTSPMQIGIECRSTKENVGVNILDELNRHIRRYENRSNTSNIIGIILCYKPTESLIKDSKTEKRYILGYEAIVSLVNYSLNYPLSPLEFENFFIDDGDVKDSIQLYLEQKIDQISKRELIISIFDNVKEELSYEEIKAHLKVRGYKLSDSELNNFLTELSSPLLNYIQKKGNCYELIFPDEYFKNHQKKLMEVKKWIL